MTDESLDRVMGGVNPASEAERVFDLIEKLMSGHNVRYRDDIDPNAVWRANFIGQPSFRHANRISILREYLDALLPGRVETVAAEVGSVVVEFAAADSNEPDFQSLSEQLAQDQVAFRDVASRVGLESLSFANQTLTF
jgi:hypothetical protein